MELKANDLRIGNYILRKGYLFEDNNFYQIIADCNDITACVSNSKHFKPIPLTEEWLFKCGFDKGSDFLGDCFFIEFDAIDDFVLHIEKDGYYWSYNQIKVNTLHQLQNLYFALTNKELEIKM